MFDNIQQNAIHYVLATKALFVCSKHAADYKLEYSKTATVIQLHTGEAISVVLVLPFELKKIFTHCCYSFLIHLSQNLNNIRWLLVLNSQN